MFAILFNVLNKNFRTQFVIKLNVLKINCNLSITYMVWRFTTLTIFDQQNFLIYYPKFKNTHFACVSWIISKDHTMPVSSLSAKWEIHKNSKYKTVQSNILPCDRTNSVYKIINVYFKKRFLYIVNARNIVWCKIIQ